jgi:membrane protein DedA with SNARE-associated domain
MLEISPFLEHFPYLGIFAFLILGGIGLPFPEDATLLLSGFLISHGITKPLPTFIVVYFGLLLTDFFLYSIGKKYGRSLVEHRRFHRILFTEKLLKFEEKFKKWSAWFLFFGRHFVGLRAQIFLTAVVMRMSLVKFLIADAAAEPHLYL